MAIIYKITNTVNGKIYIGFTAQTIEKRFKRHCRDAKLTKGNNQRLYKAMRKYGTDAFIIETLVEELDDKWAQNITESFMIAHFNSTNPDIGYNMTFGGEGGVPTDEVRRKISEAKKGGKNAFYGKTHSEKTKRKLSEANKGKTPSEETKRKLSEAHTGRTRSEETKRKLSEAKKGEKHPNYGKTLPEDTKRKISEAQKGENNHNYGKTPSEDTKRKISEAKKGKTPSEETKRKLSEAAKARCAKQRNNAKL